MRRLSALLLALLLAAGCFGDGDDDEDTPPESPYAGRFQVAAVLTANSCAIAAPLDGTFINIAVEGDTLRFGTWAVAWDEPTRHAAGTAPPLAIPIGTPPGCVAYNSVTLDLAYATADSFAGTMIVENTYSAECGSGPCGYSYEMSGVRQP